MSWNWAVRNQLWSGGTEDGSPDWMNKLDNTGKLDFENNYNTLAPQVSLKYLLTQIFEEHGWNLDTSLMTDSTWETIYMPSFYAVAWQKIVQVVDPPYFAYSPLSTITFNLQNHVPPDTFITNFIIDLRNRMNWGFDFDNGQKVCKMIPIKELAKGTKKDWTRYMGAKWTSDFTEDVKIFAFKNEIDSSDALSSAPDFSKAQYLDPVDLFTDLPTATEDNLGKVIFCFKENKYFQCRYVEETNIYEWSVFADNIYNYEPAGYNESIESQISTMPVYRSLYRDNGIDTYYGHFPLCEQEGNWEGKEGSFINWGVRLLFHRGMVWEANSLGFTGSQQYPCLTSNCFTITQEEPDLDWSLSYKHSFDGIEKGIIDYWFRETNIYRAQSEVIKGALHIPRTEITNFRWSDIILLKNIPYIMQKLPDVIPYNGVIQAELRRIG